MPDKWSAPNQNDSARRLLANHTTTWSAGDSFARLQRLPLTSARAPVRVRQIGLAEYLRSRASGPASGTGGQSGRSRRAVCCCWAADGNGFQPARSRARVALLRLCDYPYVCLRDTHAHKASERARETVEKAYLSYRWRESLFRIYTYCVTRTWLCSETVCVRQSVSGRVQF